MTDLKSQVNGSETELVKIDFHQKARQQFGSSPTRLQSAIWSGRTGWKLCFLIPTEEGKKDQHTCYRGAVHPEMNLAAQGLLQLADEFAFGLPVLGHFGKGDVFLKEVKAIPKKHIRTFHLSVGIPLDTGDTWTIKFHSRKEPPADLEEEQSNRYVSKRYLEAFRDFELEAMVALRFAHSFYTNPDSPGEEPVTTTKLEVT